MLLYYTVMIINDNHETKKIIKKPRFIRDFWALHLGAEEEMITEGEREDLE